MYENIKSIKDDTDGSRVALSLPAFQILSERDDVPVREAPTEQDIPRKQKKVKSDKGMTEKGENVPVSQSVRTPHSSRSRRSTSRHERHKCHKSKHKAMESLRVTNQNLLEHINELKRDNYVLTRKLNASVTSLDSGLSGNERDSRTLSPFELDVSTAYNHVKNENVRLAGELEKYRTHCSEAEIHAEKLEEENRDLHGDVSMLKALVFKLNLELERYQNGEAKPVELRTDLLPRNYDKNFLKPVLPLLRAYSEAIQEKSEIIDNFESDIKKFSSAFNDLLKENEKLYEELERKMNTVEGDAVNELKVLRKDLEMSKQENTLLISQLELEQEKLSEVHSVYRMKVAEVMKQNEAVNESLQEQKADLYMMKGKYSILKQEFERLKLENDSRVPMAVHSASIGECKRLFQDLKNEYESQKQYHLATITEQEQVLAQLRRQCDDRAKERNQLEKCSFENETLKKRLADFEDGKISSAVPEGERGQLISIKRQLRDSNAKVDELSNKLATTKKQLHKAMAFAEDIVREQEGLLIQLHAKQKENVFMATQFGSLKKQLKSVEKGAQAGLNTVEEKMKSLEAENAKLTTDVNRMRNSLKEKDDYISRLENEKSSNS